jgi:hypothetical protein
MIKNIWKGFNVFGKKEFLKIFIAYLLFGVYTLFIVKYITTKIDQIEIVGISLVNYTAYIINSLGWHFLLILISFFGIMFFTIYLTFIIAQTENKKKELIGDGIVKCLKFTFISFLVLLVFIIIFSILGSYLNIVTLILLILFIILGLFLLLTFYIGNVYLGLYKITVKESLERAREFVRKRFWTTIGFFILMYIVYYIIYFIFDLIYFEVFFYNTVAAAITNELFLFVITLYLINALVLFVKDQKI